MSSVATPVSSEHHLHVACPKCGEDMIRIKRHGFLKRNILPMLGYYPWECSGCRVHMLLRNRGKRKRTRKQ